MNSQLILTACGVFAAILALALSFYIKHKEIFDKRIKIMFIILLFINLIVFAYTLIFSFDDVNSPPVVVSLMPDKMNPQEAGTTIKWIATALDPEKDPVQYKFLLDGQQKTDWSYDSTWYWITSNVDTGFHTIECKVKDGSHNVDGDDSKDIDFTIITPNQPPSIMSLNPSPNSPQPAGTTIAWTAKGTDLDGDRLLYRFFLDEQPRTGWSNIPTWHWGTSTSDIGSHSIKVSVKDGKHNADGDDSKAFDFTIYHNNPPVINRLAPDMSSPQVAGTTITWTADATDIDGDQILYKFFLKGMPITDWSSNNTWRWGTSEADAGDNHIEVQIRDGKHAGPDKYDCTKSTNFKLIEAIPTITTVSIPDNTLQDANYWLSKGNDLSEQGKYIEALQAYQKNIEIDPQNGSWMNLGNALNALGMKNEAVQAYEKQFELHPKDSADLCNMVGVLIDLGRYEEALQASEKAIEIDPQFYSAWKVRGDALYSANRFDEAINAYEKTIELEPTWDAPWTMKGNALNKLGRTAEANTAFAKAKELEKTG